MPSAREVREKFEVLIDGQKRLIETLEAEQQASLRAASEARTPVLTAVRKIAAARIIDVDSVDLKSFNAPAQCDEPALDIHALAHRLKAESDAAAAGHRKVADFDKGRDLETVASERRAMTQLAQEAGQIKQSLQTVLAPIAKANKQLEAMGKPLITADNAKLYGTRDIWRYLTDRAYRIARKAINTVHEDTSYQRLLTTERLTRAAGGRAKMAEIPGLNISAPHPETPAIKPSLSENIGVLEQASRLSVSATEKSVALQQELDATQLRSQIKTPDQIVEAVREAVVQRASNTAYVETLTAQIGGRQLDGALAASVKADALEAVALDMAGQIDTARRTQSKLEEPMGKLQRAGGRNVPVDTDDIAYKVTGQNALARMRATNAGTVRENIRNHRFADNSDASTMYMMMTIAILASSDNDPYFSAQQLNASSDALGKAGLDLENLLPDVSKIDLALGNTGIDIKDFNLKGVDLGDFHVDVSSGIDAGLSSLDAGGGMSMGGGMSYGGDGGGGM